MIKMTNIDSYMVLDSRGYPTVAAKVVLDEQFYGIAYVPSGASTGQYEALELRDNNPDEYSGKGVNKSINLIK